MSNTLHQQSTVEDITIDIMKQAIETAYTAGHSSFAPLGCSGEDYILHWFDNSQRRGEVSVRLHSGDVKLLITDIAGNFLFNGGYDIGLLPISVIAKEYYHILQNVKHLITNTKRSEGISESDKEKMFKQKKKLAETRHSCF